MPCSKLITNFSPGSQQIHRGTCFREDISTVRRDIQVSCVEITGFFTGRARCSMSQELNTLLSVDMRRCAGPKLTLWRAGFPHLSFSCPRRRSLTRPRGDLGGFYSHQPRWVELDPLPLAPHSGTRRRPCESDLERPPAAASHGARSRSAWPCSGRRSRPSCMTCSIVLGDVRLGFHV